MKRSKTKTVWHNPYNVYKHIARLTSKVGAEAIEKKGKLKPVREARITAIAALAMYKIKGLPTYIQLCGDDPPDAFIMSKSKDVKGQLDISTIEVTSYREGAKETLYEQIKRTKAPEGYHLYSNEYVLLVDLLTKQPVDVDELRKYLNENKTPFPVWTFRATQLYPDTIGEMIIVNPTTYKAIVNFGKAAHELKKSGVSEVIHTVEVQKPENLKDDETSGYYNEPPWPKQIESL